MTAYPGWRGTAENPRRIESYAENDLEFVSRCRPARGRSFPGDYGPLKAEVPVGCYYDGQYYSNGAKDCQVFESMKCDNGTWDDTGSWCL